MLIGFENGKKKTTLMSLIIQGLKKQIYLIIIIIFIKIYYLLKVLCIILEKLIYKNYKGIINIGSGYLF